MDEHRIFMHVAMEEALEAKVAGEVPVGAVVVVDGEVVGRGHNASLALSDPTAHAEVLALRAAASRLGNFRLVGATLYCTVEPCLMCLGAVMHARIAHVVCGAPDLKVGALDRIDVLRASGADFNHRFEVTRGVLGNEASELLLDFFRERRAAARALQMDSEYGEVPKWS
jgi:tRNA(adenine34) deaminase